MVDEVIDIESDPSNIAEGLRNQQRATEICLKWLKDCVCIALKEIVIQVLWTYVYSSLLYLVNPSRK